MQTEIVVITDNRSNGSLAGEWGLCLLIHYQGKKILVDAGSSDLFLHNMKELGERVEDVDYAVLSHAHYDHANGFPAFLEQNKKAKLYVNDTVAANCYKKIYFLKKYIGIPRKMLEKYPDRIEKVTGNYKISEGIYLIPHTTCGLSEIGKQEMMYRRTKKGWMPDDFSHEQSLVLDTEKGLLIINSCSHGGVANIINEVREAFPDKKIYGYIGGFHLFNKSNEAIGKQEMMYRRTKKGWMPDDFSHEQSLVLDTEKGLLIINSCSHGGVANIINEVREAFPDKKIYGYIGGFHLFNKSNEAIGEVAEMISQTSVDYICTGHCTGGRAYGIFKEKLGDKIEQLQVGMRIHLS